MIKIGPQETWGIEGMLQELRERADVSASAVKQLCADLQIELVIVCGVGGEQADTMPAMLFPTEFLKWVADLGASLDVDVLA
jgi:hypothetical protein